MDWRLYLLVSQPVFVFLFAKEEAFDFANPDC